MKKNYFLKNATKTSTPLVLNCEKKSWKNTLTGLFLFLFTFLGFSDAFGQSPSVFTTNGTWTVPAGVSSITVQAWGGGGSGGSGTGGGTKIGGGGGGGGGFINCINIPVSAGQVFNINVGAGGNAVSNNNIGNPGGNSTITSGGLTITAFGGNGGTNNTGGTANGGSGSVVGFGGTTNIFNGGTGATNQGQPGGGGGAGAGTINNGNSTTTGTGATGANLGGAGGNGGASNGNGSAGSTIGGGGGGAGQNNTSGAGARGEVRITFTCPTNTAIAGTNQTLAACATTTTLAGSAVPTGMTGTWTVVSGTATITNPNSPTSSVTGLALPATNGGTATAVLRWTIDNGRCGSSSSDVTITTSRGIGCWIYCNSGGSNNTAGEISNVTFNTINRNSTFDGYINTGLSTTVIVESCAIAST